MASKIPLDPVTSSNLHALGYDPKTKRLAVSFKSGDVWHFAGIEPDLVEQLREADSKGRFFHANIKGKFTSEKMTGACPACGDRGWIGDPCIDCGTQRYVPDERAAS